MAIDIFDLIYPNYCLSCDREGDLLCRPCLGKLIIKPQKICPICKRSEEIKNCSGSRLDDLWALAHYQDYLVSDLIRKFKYEHLTVLAETVWKEYLMDFWRKHGANFDRKTILIPVPLHRKRLLHRGYNQSEIIALELSKISGLAVNNELLYRAVYHEPQVGLSASARISNVRGIFKINYRAQSDIWGRDILLIDDVYTTGSTMAECAAALNSVGFRRVSGLVLAVD